MLGIGIDIKVEAKKVEDAAEKAAFRNLGHAVASVRKAAVASIVRSPKPAPEGTPVHTLKGQAKRSVRYAVDREKEEAVAGFVESRMGTAMAAHEHGGEYKGGQFPARPTMGPALEEAAPRFAEEWEGTVGG